MAGQMRRSAGNPAIAWKCGAIPALLRLLLFGTADASVIDIQDGPREILTWSRLPDLPSSITGACTGASGGALIVAGGEQATLSINVLEGGDAPAWRRVMELVDDQVYSMSAAWKDEVVCVSRAEVLLLQWNQGALLHRHLPAFPDTAASLSGALVENTLYVASARGDSSVLKAFWALDLAERIPQWEALEPWPGPPRRSPITAALDDAFYLFGGVSLEVGEESAPNPRMLTDAYRYRPDQGWVRLAEMPHAVAAATTMRLGASHLLILGGRDGAPRVHAAEDGSPERSRDILAHHTITDTWTPMGTLPLGPVAAIRWNGDVIIDRSPGAPSAVFRATPMSTTRAFGAINYTVVGAYLLILVGMGCYFFGREKSDVDYFLARGRIPWWAAGVSIFGTQLSAITFMAIPATAYATDWVYILGTATIVLLAPVVIYVYLPFFRRLQVTTAYEYLEMRFNVVVRLFGSAAFILLQLSRMGIVIFLPAIALSAVTGINIHLAILLMGLLSTFYTALGGIEAVIWSDVLQVVVLMGGALLSLVIIVFSVDGGLAGLISTAAAHGKFHTVNWTWDHTTTAVWVVVLGWTLSNLIPYTADQAVIQRYLTTKDEKAAARSIWTNAALAIPAGLIFYGLGTALFVFYRENAASLEPALQTDAIFPLFIVQQLPVGVAGLVIAGIFAASMSSLDSSLNSVATALVTDFYKRFVPASTEQRRLRLGRALTVVLGVVATSIGLFMATYEIKSLFDVFLELLGLFGGSLAGLFALGVLTRRAHGVGALVGAVTSAMVLYLVAANTDVHFFLYAGIGILTCFGVGYSASIMIPQSQPSLLGLTRHTVDHKHVPR